MTVALEKPQEAVAFMCEEHGAQATHASGLAGRVEVTSQHRDVGLRVEIEQSFGARAGGRVQLEGVEVEEQRHQLLPLTTRGIFERRADPQHIGVEALGLLGSRRARAGERDEEGQQ